MRLGVIGRLRVAHVLFGLIFFYGVEQLFLNQFIGGAATRGYVTATFTIGMLVFDIPTGMLADRIGRKNSLLLAAGALAGALGIMGTSHSLLQYLIGSLLFSLFIALWNGASQALLYDHLAVTKEQARYAKEQGLVYALFLLGVATANAASGFMAHAFGLPATFYLSIIPAVLAGVVIAGITEPPLEQEQEAVWYMHLHEITQEMRRNPAVVTFALRFIVSEFVLLTIGEFGQIYMLSFGISAIMLGIFWAVDALFAAGGRYISYRLQTRARLFIGIYGIVLAVFASVTHRYGIGIFWLLMGANEALQNIAETEVQHATRANVRATTLSIVTFAANAISVPAIFGFNYLYTHHSIITANRAVAVTAVGVLLVTVVTERTKLASSR